MRSGQIDPRLTPTAAWRGELSDAKLTDKARLTRTVERAVLDALAYVHAKAAAIRGEGDEGAVLQLQSADETLGGKQLRGSGLVYCERGRSLFQRALAECSLSLQPTLSAEGAAQYAGSSLAPPAPPLQTSRALPAPSPRPPTSHSAA